VLLVDTSESRRSDRTDTFARCVDTMIFWRLHTVGTHAYNPAHPRTQVSEVWHLLAVLSGSGCSLFASVRQPAESTTGNDPARTALLRDQTTHRCLSIVSQLGSVLGLTFGISLVGAALQGATAAAICSMLDDSERSSTRLLLPVARGALRAARWPVAACSGVAA
jgi:hypothetical protein